MRNSRIASRWRDLISRYCCISGVSDGADIAVTGRRARETPHKTGTYRTIWPEIRGSGGTNPPPAAVQGGLVPALCDPQHILASVASACVVEPQGPLDQHVSPELVVLGHQRAGIAPAVAPRARVGGDRPIAAVHELSPHDVVRQERVIVAPSVGQAHSRGVAEQPLVVPRELHELLAIRSF